MTIPQKRLLFPLLPPIGVILMAVTLGCSQSGQTEAWKNISVDVQADRAVETTQRLVREDGGLHRLAITISNPGIDVLTLESIEVRIPVDEPITDAMLVAYGSTCMGQRPLLIHAAGEPRNSSYSYMYAMVRRDVDDFLFAGSLSWRIFLPVITWEGNGFVVRSDGSGRQLQPGETIQYEQIVLGRPSDWQAVLDTFGDAIAKENGIEGVKDVEFTGWSTWDYYGYAFDVDDILENADALREIAPNANLVQIDAGWYSQRGDFGQTRADFPGGMAELNRQIEERGMMTGVWIDGFRANMDSEVYKNHPEYFLHDQDGNVIVRLFTSRQGEGGDPTRIYFDYSHPGARAHMAEAIRVIREKMGITYFKIDFLRFGLDYQILRFEREGTRIVPYDESITDVERMRLGMQAMREAVGEENYLLGCSVVFGPAIGFVDGMRTGGDIHPHFDIFPVHVLANMGNAYLSGKVFNGDSDFIVLREAADEDEQVSQATYKSGGSLSLNEAQMWADFVKMYGNFRLSGDKLTTLRPERIKMMTEVFDFPVIQHTLPIDFWQRARDRADSFELLLGHDADGNIYLGLFNWSDEAKTYPVAAFGKGPQTLAPRHSKILKYDGDLSFTQLGRSLSTGLN